MLHTFIAAFTGMFKMSDLNSLVQTLKGLMGTLPPSDRQKFAASISAAIGGDLTSVGGTETAGRITTLSAGTAEEAREKLTPLQAANAFGPNAFGLVRNVISRAGRLGYVMKENEKVDMVKLDAALAGKEISSRMALKADLARLRLI
jgi:hypothetical protein